MENLPIDPDREIASTRRLLERYPLAPVGSIDREQSKVLLLVHADKDAARQSVQAVIQAYRHAFGQQSVLWESAQVCVAG